MNQINNTAEAPLMPPATLPGPPNHRCPYCGNQLEPEEVKNNECWVCFNSPFGPGTDTDADEINPN